MAKDFRRLEAEYAYLWGHMEIRPAQRAQVNAVARRLIGSKPRYQQVSAITHVPWVVIAVLHMLEDGGDFSGVFHNGEHIIGTGRRTVRPPQNRGPFSTWEESAIDAVTMPPHNLHEVDRWTIERTCYELERYGGFRYRDHHPEVKSPYLWSFSNNYESGKYADDGWFDPNAVEPQFGAMPIIRQIMELDSSVGFNESPLETQASTTAESASEANDSEEDADLDALETGTDEDSESRDDSDSKETIDKDLTCTLWFGSNRKPLDARDIHKGFSGDRDSQVHFGRCKVHIPESHKIGSIGSPWWKRVLTGVDDRLKITTIEEYAAAKFWGSVAAHLRKLSADEREAVIFVHGYNVSFGDAALRAAQIGADLAIRGCMAFFSWPSKGSTEDYMHDEASIEASESHITEFLVDFAERSGATKLHIIAHSMGNRGILRAVNRIAAEATQRTGKPFDQMILAAPDVDADVFRDLCSAYSRVSRQTTLYVSSKDWAVGAACWLHGFPRAGLLPPIMVAPGIDTINVTHADLTMLGHGYVAQARLVLTDMHALLRFGAPPKDRAGLKLQTSQDGRTYWLIGK